MNDRELLELAAKAAEIQIDFTHTNGGGRFNTGFDAAGNAVLDWHNYKTWNPLTDDGDALRLAIQLRMSVNVGPTEACVETLPWALRGEFLREELGQDPAAAVRRAILRAAAKLGDSMP